MVSNSTFRKVALALAETQELPHREKPSFRVRKKIFAVLWEKERQAVLKFSPIDQSVFSTIGESVFYPVKSGWGKYGWTIVDLTKVKLPALKDALSASWFDALSRQQLKLKDSQQ